MSRNISMPSRRSVIRLGTALALAVTSTGLTACSTEKPATGGEGAAKALQKLHIGYQSASDYGLFYLAREKGWFKDAGIDVELSLFDDGGAQIEALASRSVDVTLQGAQPPLLAFQKGTAPIRLIGPVADAAGLFSIVASPGVKEVTDLKGKKVAVTAGTAYDFYLDNVLQKFGMSPTDIQKIDLQPLDGQGAFLSGQVDAVVPLATSRYLIVEKKPDAVVVFQAGDFEKSPKPSAFSLYDLMVTTETILKEKSQAIQALVDVYYSKLMPYVADPQNKGSVIEELTDWQVKVVKAPTSAKDVQAQLGGYGFYSVDRAKKVAESGEFIEQVAGQAQFLVDSGKMSKVPDVAAMVDLSFIKKLK